MPSNGMESGLNSLQTLVRKGWVRKIEAESRHGDASTVKFRSERTNSLKTQSHKVCTLN